MPTTGKCTFPNMTPGHATTSCCANLEAAKSQLRQCLAHKGWLMCIYVHATVPPAVRKRCRMRVTEDRWRLAERVGDTSGLE